MSASSPAPETPIAFRAVRGAFWVLITSYWNIGFGFAANILMMRLLDSEAYGTFALAMFFAQIFRLQPKIGLGYAFVQRKDTASETLGTYLKAEAVLAVSGLLVSLLAAPILVLLGYSTLVVQISIIGAGAAMAEGLAGIGSTLGDKELLFRPTSLAQSLSQTVSYLPAFWMAMNGYGVWSLVVQTAAYNGLLLLSTLWVLNRYLRHLWNRPWGYSWQTARELVLSGLKVGMVMLAGTLLTQIDNFTVGTLAGTVALGFYDRAYRTAQWPSTILTSLLTRAGFYTYARLQDDLPRLRKTLDMVVWVIAMLSLPLTIALFTSAPDMTRWLYTEKWAASVPFLRILLIYSIMRPFMDNAGALFIAIGKPGLMTRIILVQVGLLALLGPLATLTWGVYGIAAVVAGIYLLGFGLVVRLIHRHLSINLVGLYVYPAVISLVVVAMTMILNRFTPINTLGVAWRTLIKSAFAFSAFFGLTLLTQPADTVRRMSYIVQLLRQRS